MYETPAHSTESITQNRGQSFLAGSVKEQRGRRFDGGQPTQCNAVAIAGANSAADAFKSAGAKFPNGTFHLGQWEKRPVIAVKAQTGNDVLDRCKPFVVEFKSVFPGVMPESMNDRPKNPLIAHRISPSRLFYQQRQR
jgi:hypothetical protein